MSVLVLSPTGIIAEALVLLLANHGIEAHRDVTRQADCVLRNLIGVKPPYPDPHSAPTYALIEMDALKERVLLQQGYRRCFDVSKGPEALIAMLKAQSKEGNAIDRGDTNNPKTYL